MHYHINAISSTLGHRMCSPAEAFHILRSLNPDHVKGHTGTISDLLTTYALDPCPCSLEDRSRLQKVASLVGRVIPIPLLHTDESTLSYLETLLERKEDVPPAEIKEALLKANRIFGSHFAQEVFVRMYKDHTPKVTTLGLWEDVYIGKKIYRPLLKEAVAAAKRPVVGGAGGPLPSVISHVGGMFNETGNDCYLIAAWNLLSNVPRLRNQILKNLPDTFMVTDGTDRLVNLKPLKAFTRLNLQSKTMHGSRSLRTAFDELVGKSSGRRAGDAGEIIFHLASTLPPDLSCVILPEISLRQSRRDRHEATFTSNQAPLVIATSERSFETSMAARFGRHRNKDLTSAIRSETIQFTGPPPPDLFVSINRRRPLDFIAIHPTYTLPEAFAMEAGPANYTLQAFIHWTGGHYLSFCKNADHTWTMVNDELASTPSKATLDYYRSLASIVYYTRDDAPVLDEEADNLWWKGADST